MPPRLTVYALPIGRPWTPLGTDQRRGVWVENFQCSSDEFGPADASMTLKRDPRIPWPDIGFWTPIRAKLDNQRVWAGRFIGSPGKQDGTTEIDVTAQGLQYQMDDVPLDQLYVANSLSAWGDIRSNLNCDLTVQRAVWQLSSDPGGLTITAPNTGLIEVSSRGGYLIDLGPGQLAQRVVYSWKHSNNAPSISLGIVAGSSVAAVSNGSIGAITTLATTPTGTAAITTSARYIWIGLYNNTGGTVTPGADCYVQLTALQVFASTAYESGGASILTADVVADDIFTNHLPQITKALISAASFDLPTLSANQQTPRDVLTQANSFQDWQFRIREDSVFEYRPRPSSAIVSMSDQTLFQDLSAGSGDTLYNQVTYTGTGPDGTPVEVTRTTTLAGLPVTIPDRRGLVKAFTIQSSATLTAAAASQLCDVFLEQRNRTPFKGTISATSRRSVRIRSSGAACPVYHLLRLPGELTSFPHLRDPDTASLGRVGRIAKVTYTHASDSAQVDIDSTPGSFEAMSARLAVVTAR